MPKQSKVEIDTGGIDRLIKEEPGKVNAWMRGVADQMLGDIVLSFGTSPGGAVYTRGSVTHIASQPGYPPNVDTNALRGSMHVEPKGMFEFWIEDGVEHGIMMEDGTSDIAPRPFVAPVFDDWSRKIGDDAKENLGLGD